MPKQSKKSGGTLADGRPGGTRTLSEGRPGSRHPISEARPTQRQQHSVEDDNPHGDTKVSSATGLTQEREHETLAEGEPKVD